MGESRKPNRPLAERLQRGGYRRPLTDTELADLSLLIRYVESVRKKLGDRLDKPEDCLDVEINRIEELAQGILEKRR